MPHTMAFSAKNALLFFREKTKWAISCRNTLAVIRGSYNSGRDGLGFNLFIVLVAIERLGPYCRPPPIMIWGWLAPAGCWIIRASSREVLDVD
jgi:hypothetical protein